MRPLIETDVAFKRHRSIFGPFDVASRSEARGPVRAATVEGGDDFGIPGTRPQERDRTGSGRNWELDERGRGTGRRKVLGGRVVVARREGRSD